MREEVDRSFRSDEAGVVRIPRIHSWADVVAILSLASIFMGGLVWGMKLEARYDTLDSKINTNRTEWMGAIESLRTEISATRADTKEIKGMLQKGILPVTEARLAGIEERLHTVEREHSKLRE